MRYLCGSDGPHASALSVQKKLKTLTADTPARLERQIPTRRHSCEEDRAVFRIGADYLPDSDRLPPPGIGGVASRRS